MFAGAMECEIGVGGGGGAAVASRQLQIEGLSVVVGEVDAHGHPVVPTVGSG